MEGSTLKSIMNGSSVRVGRLIALLCGGFVAYLVVGLALLPRVLSSAIVCVKCGWLVGCLFRLVSLCVVAWNSPSIPLFSLPVSCCYFLCVFCVFWFCIYLPLCSLLSAFNSLLVVLLAKHPLPPLMNRKHNTRYAVLITKKLSPISPLIIVNIYSTYKADEGKFLSLSLPLSWQTRVSFVVVVPFHWNSSGKGIRYLTDMARTRGTSSWSMIFASQTS